MLPKYLQPLAMGMKRTDALGPLRGTRNCAFRSRFSRVIAVLAAIFWIVYLNRDATLPIDSFRVQLIFSSLELVVIVSFLSYLASFAPDLFRYELNGSSHAERL